MAKLKKAERRKIRETVKGCIADAVENHTALPVFTQFGEGREELAAEYAQSCLNDVVSGLRRKFDDSESDHD